MQLCSADRYGTPTHRPAKDKKQPASILKATSGLKNASSVFAPKSSPSTSTTPKEASVEAFKQRARVSFNPAVSYVSVPSPSYSSASHSSAAGQRKRRSRVLVRDAPSGAWEPCPAPLQLRVVEAILALSTMTASCFCGSCLHSSAATNT